MNCFSRARWVRSPETTTRCGRAASRWRRRGARTAGSTRPKCRSEMWARVRMSGRHDHLERPGKHAEIERRIERDDLAIGGDEHAAAARVDAQVLGARHREV